VRHKSPGRDSFESGTAFFVSETTLLTAGHMARQGNTDFRIQLPGTFQAELFVEQLFEQGSEVPTIECEIVKNQYTRGVDICLLRVKGDFKAKRHLQIKRTDFSPGEAVDVMGYPGDYPSRYVRKMHTGPRVTRASVDDVEQLFPKCELTVSHGNIESAGSMPTYLLSTVVGMSGSPVLKFGEAIGKEANMTSK
jgi:Trypsin-like peptidase domain